MIDNKSTDLMQLLIHTSFISGVLENMLVTSKDYQQASINDCMIRIKECVDISIRLWEDNAKHG